MRLTLLVHILAGGLGLVFGYVALYAAKGAPLHRRSGLLFVYAMLPMALFGMSISAFQNVAPEINIPAGLLTSYLVMTALTTVRPPTAASRWLNVVAMLVALTVGVTMLTFGLEALANGGTRNARHLWRMSFALFIAALSFSVQLAKMIPRPVRIPALIALPMLAVLVTMLYWLWRVRIRRPFRGIVGASTREFV